MKIGKPEAELICTFILIGVIAAITLAAWYLGKFAA
jgi:hypothetical protein